MNITPKKSKILDESSLPDFEEINRMRETKNSFSITFNERNEIEDGMNYVRDFKRHSWNTLITFSFEISKDYPERDVGRVRKLAHYVRVINRVAKRETYMGWSRHNEIGTNIESVMFLTSVDDRSFPTFKVQVEKWKFENFSVERIADDTEPNRLRQGRYVSVRDELLRACDSYTKYRKPNIFFEDSGLIKGRMSFCSFSMHKHRVIPYKVQKMLADFDQLGKSAP